MSPEPSGYADWYPDAQAPGNAPAPEPVAPFNSTGNAALDAALAGYTTASGWRRLAAGGLDGVVANIPLVSAYVLPPMFGYELTNGGSAAAFAVAFLVIVVNCFVVPVSFGKRVLGIQAVRAVRYLGGQGLVRPGVWRTFLRLFLHLFELTTYLWLVAFFTKRRRTISDALSHVLHIRVPDGPVPNLSSAPSDAIDLA